MKKESKFFDRESIVIISIMAVGILILIADSLWFKGWVSAAYWGFGLSAVYGLYAFLKGGAHLQKIWVFALIAGFVELLADHYLVSYTGTLVYPKNEPMLWTSPLYMPFSWLAVLFQIGYIGWKISFKLGKGKAAILLLVLGSIIIPLYEHWAINAGWWYYQAAPMKWDVPYYISLAEGLLMLSIPFLLRMVTDSKWKSVIILGIIQGLIMLVASFIAYNLLG